MALKAHIKWIFGLAFLFSNLAVVAQFKLASSNLPIVVINTNGSQIADDPKIVADMKILFKTNNARNNIDDAPLHFNGKIGIEIRGQSSQFFPMKSYGLELRDASGLNSINQSLFGLPAESDWILYAPYTDKTLMRNVLAYDLSRRMGHWAAHTRLVELVLNGEYQGVYVFMEKIKRVEGRLNLAKMQPTDLNGDALTGGYIFSLDKQPNGWFSSFQAPNSSNGAGRQFSYVYPQLKDIATAQKDFIKYTVDAFEKSLAATNFQDPFNGVRKHADLPSFIDYMLVNEVSHNVDGYRLSSYFHKDRDSKNPRIFAGPVWDYDLAFRNAEYCDASNTAGWTYQFNYTCPGDGAGLIPFWWERLMMDTAYRTELGCRWKSLRQNILLQSSLEQWIDSVAGLLGEAQQRHFQRWPILGVYVWPNPQPIARTYAEEISYLKNWLQSRLFWLDANMPYTGRCYEYPVSEKGNLMVKVGPVPLSLSTNMELASRNSMVVRLRVMDASGRILKNNRLLLNPGINKVALDNGKWSSGVYILELESDKGDRIIRKLVK